MTLLYLWAKFWKKIRGSAIINSKIHTTSKVEPGSSIVNTTFDRYSFCGYDCTIINCSVGAFCSIANNVSIGGSKHPIEWVSTSPVFRSRRDSVKKKFSEHDYVNSIRTFIGNDVWIGENVLIKQGVRVGNGAIIGMGSIVTKDVGDYMIVAGSPAKLIKKRFDDILIQKLIEIQWWNFEDEKLHEYAQYFTNPNEFIKAIELDQNRQKELSM